MIKYCLSAFILIACSATGLRTADDVLPVPVVVLPEMEIKATRIKPEAMKPARSIKHARSPCESNLEDKKQEILYKLDCVKRLTGGSGA